MGATPMLAVASRSSAKLKSARARFAASLANARKSPLDRQPEIKKVCRANIIN